MSPVVKNNTTMNINLVMDSSIPIAGVGVSTSVPESIGNDHTATGIPVSLLWMPYIGFSLILIILMIFSFLHYHRKHGHKYHHRQQFWGNEMSVASVLGSIQNQVVSIGRRAGSTNDSNTGGGGSSSIRTRKDSNTRQDSKDAPRKKGIGYRGVEEYIPPPLVNNTLPSQQPPPHNIPPNGGLRIARSNKSDTQIMGDVDNRKIDLRGSHHYHNPHHTHVGSSTHRILPSQPTAQPLSNPQHRPGHRPRPRNPHCDEPSTSSSTVSSKTSNQSAKPGSVVIGGSSRSKRSAHNHRQKRPLGPLVFEANENGSMVDVRVNLKDDAGTIELKPTPKERGPPNTQPYSVINPHHPNSSMQEGTVAQRQNNSNRYSASMEDTYIDSGTGRRKLPNNYWASDNNTPPSHNPSHRGSKYRDTNFDEYSLYEERNSRSTSLPIWSTMPLCPKPEPPRRDFYSYPFTPSGHMEMLSDTENDEVFLLQHTKL